MIEHGASVYPTETAISQGWSALTSPKAAHLMGEPFFQVLGMRRSGRPWRLCDIRNVLVVRLDEIGDAVLTSPLLRELRRNLAKAWITVVVTPLTFSLFERCPYVDEVLVYDTSRLPRRRPFKRHAGALSLAFRRLWRRRFDLALVPRWDADAYHATFVAYFSGAPRRIGYTEHTTPRKAHMNSGFDILFTDVLSDIQPKHEVKRNLQVLRCVGGDISDETLEAWTDPEDDAFAREVLGVHDPDGVGPLVALVPGALHAFRAWPVSNFIALGRWLRDAYGAHMVVVGGTGDKELGLRIERELAGSVVNIAGQTTLRQTVAVLRACNLYVGNDTGPMHIAAAVGTPVVEISSFPESGDPSHQQSPARFGPWGVPHAVLQPASARPPCDGACTARTPHCILGVTAERVKTAIADQLSRAHLSTTGNQGVTTQ